MDKGHKKVIVSGLVLHFTVLDVHRLLGSDFFISKKLRNSSIIRINMMSTTLWLQVVVATSALSVVAFHPNQVRGHNHARLVSMNVQTAATDKVTTGTSKDADILIRAYRGEKVERTPVWLMRQAGRYMADFRQYSEKYPFRQRSETPEIAIELSLQPWRSFGVDGVIMFSDILTPLPALGVDFTIVEKKGPKILNPLRDQADVDALKPMHDVATQVRLHTPIHISPSFVTLHAHAHAHQSFVNLHTHMHMNTLSYPCVLLCALVHFLSYPSLSVYPHISLTHSLPSVMFHTHPLSHTPHPIGALPGPHPQRPPQGDRGKDLPHRLHWRPLDPGRLLSRGGPLQAVPHDQENVSGEPHPGARDAAQVYGCAVRVCVVSDRQWGSGTCCRAVQCSVGEFFRRIAGDKTRRLCTAQYSSRLDSARQKSTELDGTVNCSTWLPSQHRLSLLLYCA